MSVKRNTLLGSVAGSAAVAVRGAAEVLFGAAGSELLSEGTRQGLRHALVKSSAAVVDTFAPALSPGAHEATKLLAEQGAQAASRAALVGGAGVEGAAATALAREAVKAAGREVLKSAGKAAGVGFVLDGAVGAYEGIRAYQRGEMTSREAVAHAAVEASTGAAAVGAGVLLSAGLVAVTGGAAAPVVFAVAAGGSIGAKLALRRLVDKARPRTAALEPSPVPARVV